MAAARQSMERVLGCRSHSKLDTAQEDRRLLCADTQLKRLRVEVIRRGSDCALKYA